MKKWIVIVALLAAAGAGWKVWNGSTTTNNVPDSTVSVRTGQVETRDIDFAVSVAGEIVPAEKVSVRPEINGKIEALPVHIGDKVNQGELLFRLDDRDLQIEIESRKTAIEKARIQLKKANREYKRDRELFQDELISKDVFEESRTAYDLARNEVERAQRELELANDRLSKTRIVAPFDCTVLTRPVSVGQAVSGSGGYNSGTEVLTIADLDNMIVEAHVNQTDVIRLQRGMEVTVDAEAVAGLAVKGEVKRVAPQATVKNGIKGFECRIAIQEIDPRIQPGMTANVTIPVESADNVAAIPLAAVFTEPNEETGEIRRFAYLRSGDAFFRKRLEIGISDYFGAEVLSGVAAGDIVALEKPPEERIREPQDAEADPAEQRAETANNDET